MNATTLAAILDQAQTPVMQTPTIIEECPRDNTPAMDGTGAHLGLRTPWWNDGVHDLTDSTLFRWLLVIIVAERIWKYIR